MTNTYKFAERELSILSQSSPDPDNRPIIEPFYKEILALCETFGKSGQSGGSAPTTATAISQAVKKLCLKEPICPITGLPDEWVDVSEYSPGKNLFQNARESALFKYGVDGRPYYLDAISWEDEKGCGWHSNSVYVPGSGEKLTSRQYVKEFPFTPKRFYIDVVSTEIAKDDWVFTVKNISQLQKVFKYYDKMDSPLAGN